MRLWYPAGRRCRPFEGWARSHKARSHSEDSNA